MSKDLLLQHLKGILVKGLDPKPKAIDLLTLKTSTASNRKGVPTARNSNAFPKH